MSRPAFNTLDLQACQLGASAGEFALSTREDNRQAVAHLATQARRHIALFTPDLELNLYDQTPFIDALTQLAINNARAQIRVLIKDSQAAIKHGHRLIELSRRLSSYIEIRRVHSDYQDYNESFLLVDSYGLLHRLQANRFEGYISCKAALEVRRLQAYFDEVWNRSEPDIELRRLHL